MRYTSRRLRGAAGGLFCYHRERVRFMNHAVIGIILFCHADCARPGRDSFANDCGCSALTLHSHRAKSTVARFALRASYRVSHTPLFVRRLLLGRVSAPFSRAKFINLLALAGIGSQHHSSTTPTPQLIWQRQALGRGRSSEARLRRAAGTSSYDDAKFSKIASSGRDVRLRPMQGG